MDDEKKRESPSPVSYSFYVTLHVVLITKVDDQKSKRERDRELYIHFKKFEITVKLVLKIYEDLYMLNE